MFGSRGFGRVAEGQIKGRTSIAVRAFDHSVTGTRIFQQSGLRMPLASRLRLLECWVRMVFPSPFFFSCLCLSFKNLVFERNVRFDCCLLSEFGSCLFLDRSVSLCLLSFCLADVSISMEFPGLSLLLLRVSGLGIIRLRFVVVCPSACFCPLPERFFVCCCCHSWSMYLSVPK